MPSFVSKGQSGIKGNKARVNGKQLITDTQLIGTEAEENPIYWPGETKSGITVRDYAGTIQDLAVAVHLSKSKKDSSSGALEITLVSPDGVRIPIAGTKVSSGSLGYRQPGIEGLIDRQPFELQKESQSFLFSENRIKAKNLELSSAIRNSLIDKKSDLSLSRLGALNGTSPNGRWQVEIKNSGDEAVRLNGWQLLFKTDKKNMKLGGGESSAEMERRKANAQELHPETTLNQAVRALDADSARVKYGVDGSGVRIGVLSNTFNSMGGAPWDYKTGVLDENLITVALERDGLQGRLTAAEDEGRAMIQNIHSIAPGAETVFYSWYDEYFNDTIADAAQLSGSEEKKDDMIRMAFDGYSIQQEKFRQALIELATTYDCDIIVDDLDDSEPWFEDGPMAKAIEYVTKEYGVSYFSAAGNSTNNSYTAEFKPTVKADLTADLYNELPEELQTALDQGSEIHLFQGQDGSSSLLQQIVYQQGINMQWNSKWGDNEAEVEVMIFDKDKNFVGRALTDPNGKNPWAYIPQPAGGPREPSYIALIHSGATSYTRPGVIKWIGGQVTEVSTNSNLGYYSGTAMGHSNTSASASVNSAQYWSTPAYRAQKPAVSRFGSWGVTPIYYDEAGNRLAEPELRETPMFVTPQKGNTSFFSKGYDEQYDTEGDFLQNFEGTSAAAPNAAAVAALMLQFNPSLTTSDIFAALKKSAKPIKTEQSLTDGSGFNNASGFGLINAMAALDQLSGSKQRDKGKGSRSIENGKRSSLLYTEAADALTGLQTKSDYTDIILEGSDINGSTFSRESLFLTTINKKENRDVITQYDESIRIRGDLLIQFRGPKKETLGSHTILKAEELSGEFHKVMVNGLDEELYVGVGIKGGNRLVVRVSESSFSDAIQTGFII